VDKKVKGQASEADRRVGDKFKSVWGNLQVMPQQYNFQKLTNTKGCFGMETTQKHLRSLCIY
jgi:hypothetical protein